MVIKMSEFYPEGFLKKKSVFNSRLASISALVKARELNTILEAPVIMCDSEHNMTVDLGGVRGIIPREEGAIGIKEGITKDIALISRVGKTVCFTVTDVLTKDDGRFFAVLSRKNAQKICYEEYISRLKPGDIIDAKITHLENFGAFCDIGCGNIALLPIDRISVSRISHPSDRFFSGQNIKAIVSRIEDNGRITLSHKELLGTWEENVSLFSVGETVTGVIRSVEDYGVFVELTPNLAGLAEPREGIKVGQYTGVYIKNIIPEKMKVKLIIIDTFENAKQTEIRYFYEGDSIKEFYYSPGFCEKQITSFFA